MSSPFKVSQHLFHRCINGLHVTPTNTNHAPELREERGQKVENWSVIHFSGHNVVVDLCVLQPPPGVALCLAAPRSSFSAGTQCFLLKLISLLVSIYVRS